MKKLLTLVIVLALALSLALPAMATVGFGPQAETTAAAATQWSVKITALSFVPATTGFTFENNYYQDYDPTAGIVAGSDIRFVVEVTFPKLGDIDDADLFENAVENMVLTISGNNLAFGWNGTVAITGVSTQGHEYWNGSFPRITTNSPTKSVKYMEYSSANYSDYPFVYSTSALNSVDYYFSAQNSLNLSSYYTTTYAFMFVADVLTTADVTVTAGMSAYGSNSQFTKGGSYNFTYGDEVYLVDHTYNSDGTSYYDICNVDTANSIVRFTTDTKDQITNVAVTYDYGVTYYYDTVEPLTYSELTAAQALVDTIVLGTNPYLVDLYNAQEITPAVFQAWLASYAAGATTLTDAVAAILNDFVEDEPFAAGDLVASLSDIAGVTGDETSLDDYDALLTSAGVILWAAYETANADYVTAITDAAYGYGDEAAAWNIYNLLYEDGDLVIGVPGDQIASSITGKPYGVSYKTSVPFLGRVAEDTALSHCQWWNVNKDVALTEIVFNVNDAVHSDGYELNATGDDGVTAATRVDEFKYVAGHNTLNQTAYYWCDTAKSGLDVYGEIEYLYDEVNVTASKDVNTVAYNKLYPIFKEIMTVLGFEWDGTTAYMYRAAFVEKFGGKLDASASYTYAAYTAALIVADPNAAPPQTGESSTVLGFVMIAVALSAAAAVIIKKVRA